MITTGIKRGVALLAALPLVLLGLGAETLAQGDWLQWGGPTRNFVAKSKGLASSWPEKGPRQLWTRDLGEGHSAVIADGDRLYTMYSRGERETVVALEAATGKTLWEHSYEAPTAGMNYEFGQGPHSTPIVVGNQLYTVGGTAKLHALDKGTGKVIWFHDLWKEYKGNFEDRGYSSSPIAYKNTVILTVGGAGQTLMAFNQKDGTVAWKKHDLMTSPSSHIVINLGGQDQLVAFLGKEIAGLDPNNGELLWSHPHATDYGLNITSPVWGEDNLLFVSSAYSGGSRVIRLTRKDGKTTPSEVWFHRRMRVHHGTAVRVGDYVYGSSGDFGPAFVVAVDVKTGNVAWQDRSFSKSNLLYADGKLIILDEDGNLALATASPAGLKVVSKVALMKTRSWTAPTLVGTKLYVRDRRSITALDLS